MSRGEEVVATVLCHPAKSEVFNVSLDSPMFLFSEHSLNTSTLRELRVFVVNFSESVGDTY